MESIRPVLLTAATVVTVSAVLFTGMKLLREPQPEPVAELSPPELFEMSNWPPPPPAKLAPTTSPATSPRRSSASAERADRGELKSSQGAGSRSAPSTTPAAAPPPVPAEDTQLDSAGQPEPGGYSEYSEYPRYPPSTEPSTESAAQRDDRKRRGMTGDACDRLMLNQWGCSAASGADR